MADQPSSLEQDDLMESSNKIQPNKRRARPWHRILGLLTALPLVWVVLTGAVLNHTVDWHLDQIQVTHPWVLAAYGMKPSGNPVGVDVHGHQIVEWDGQVFLDAVAVEVSGHMVGALIDGDGLAIVTDSQVMRLDAHGQVIETLDGASVPPAPLRGVSVVEGVGYLQNDEGWFAVSSDWLEFKKHEGDFKNQQLVAIDDSSQRKVLELAWSRGGLPASRVLLDIHAGHFLGSFSKYFYDGVALCTLLLCVTGLILFFRKPRRAK